MNGHFEVEQSAYPIGYLRAGGDYKVCDMRSLTFLHSHSVSIEQAKSIAAKTNQYLRAKKLPLDIDHTEVKEFIEAEVSKL